MHRRITRLIAPLILAVAALGASSLVQAKTNIEVNMDPVTAKSEMAPVWLGYAMARARYISAHFSDYQGQTGVIASAYVEEVEARFAATKMYNELRAKDLPANRYFDDLSKVITAGYMPEYTWVNLHQASWKTAPPDERLDAYRKWAKKNLAGHKVETHGQIVIKAAAADAASAAR
ncbi:hypothetical protein IGB42_01940 [Andreprevotia sp. IGB-42]|uniref:hypothetical protein n=1 Tax=Andreprevotia sp. IGB-42 TaxID=2497473 RepID=UPI001357C92C|nr:hypothetical protein [Andreprevotia sp. IGB-42]KAF0813589.1 hypothetical protein IGB42_01940 [Andreprevotia sp. IGB-42]